VSETTPDPIQSPPFKRHHYALALLDLFWLAQKRLLTVDTFVHYIVERNPDVLGDHVWQVSKKQLAASD
jgi:hypothetical protein